MRNSVRERIEAKYDLTEKEKQIVNGIKETTLKNFAVLNDKLIDEKKFKKWLKVYDEKLKEKEMTKKEKGKELEKLYKEIMG